MSDVKSAKKAPPSVWVVFSEEDGHVGVFFTSRSAKRLASRVPSWTVEKYVRQTAPSA